MLTPASSIAILGYGEDCRRIAAALAPRGCAIRVFDARVDQTPAGRQLRAQIESLGVDVATGIGGALHAARLVLVDGDCPVIGIDQHLASGQMVLDLRRDPSPLQGANGFSGWFGSVAADAREPRVLHIAGAEAQKLAAALTAIGLHSEATMTARPPDSNPAGASTSPARTGRTPPPVVRRGELP